MFLDYFDVLILKIFFLNKIILILFKIKNILKNNYNYSFRVVKQHSRFVVHDY